MKANMKIVSTALVRESILNIEPFGNTVNLNVNKMQENGIEVEIQYQQSDKFITALIVGRK